MDADAAIATPRRKRTRGPAKPKLIIYYNGESANVDEEIERWLRTQAAFFYRSVAQEICYRLKEVMAGRLGALAAAERDTNGG